MFVFLEKHPSKLIMSILLIVGSILFLPCYCYNYWLVTSIMNMKTLGRLLSSFDMALFNGIIASLKQDNHLSTLFRIYLVNIISVTGFALLVFSLTLSIARSIKQTSYLRRIAFVIPMLLPVIAVLDIFSSVLFLYIAHYPDAVSKWMVYVIDICYVTRLPLVYLVLLWMIVGGIILLIWKVRNEVKKISKSTDTIA